MEGDATDAHLPLQSIRAPWAGGLLKKSTGGLDRSCIYLSDQRCSGGKSLSSLGNLPSEEQRVWPAVSQTWKLFNSVHKIQLLGGTEDSLTSDICSVVYGK